MFTLVRISFNTYVIQNNIDAVFLTETWMATDDPVVIGELKPDGYSFLSFPRGTTNHGGIGVLFKKQLSYRVHHLSFKSVSFEYASILDPNNGVHYVIVYRPYQSPKNKFTVTGFLDEYGDFLHEICLLPGKLVILGDFNIHLDQPHKSEVSRFNTITSSFGLQQHVKRATHRDGHIIDLVLTRSEDDLVRLCDVGLYFGSDHRMVSCILQQRKPPPLRSTCTLRDFRKVVPSAFQCDLKLQLHEIWPADLSPDVNDLLEFFENASRQVLDTHAPESTRSRTIRPRPKWYDDDIRIEKRESRRLERKWRKSRLQIDRDTYMTQHQKLVKMIEQSKQKYFKEILHVSNTKDTFKTLGILLNKNSKILPTLYTPDKLCNKFAEFFTDKVSKIRKKMIVTL
jgi:hypothetical protein